MPIQYIKRDTHWERILSINTMNDPELTEIIKQC